MNTIAEMEFAPGSIRSDGERSRAAAATGTATGPIRESHGGGICSRVVSVSAL